MELSQLKYYVTIAETLNFTKAATLLRVSQPALSYQMKKLEVELGTKLFNRERRKISLTPDGELFLPLAQGLLSRADAAVRVLKEHLGVEVGEVRMGANPSVATYIIPPLLASFRRDYQQVTVHMHEAGDQELQRAVIEGAIDFAVLTAPSALPGLEVVSLGTEELLLVVHPSHRLSNRTAVGLAELAPEEFVFPTKSFNVTSHFLEACRRVGFEPIVAYQTGSFESVKSCVREGLGISVLPQMALEKGGSDGMVVLALEQTAARKLNLISSKDDSMTGVARALMHHIITGLTGLLEETDISDLDL